MEKIKMLTIIGILILIISNIGFAQDTHSGQPVRQTGQTGSHASTSAGHSISASGQVVSGVSAVPLSLAGSTKLHRAHT